MTKVKVLAQKGSTKKALVYPVLGDKDFMKKAVEKLKETYGDAEWILVDELGPGEVMTCEDTTEYNGYNSDIERYADIVKVY